MLGNEGNAGIVLVPHHILHPRHLKKEMVMVGIDKGGREG